MTKMKFDLAVADVEAAETDLSALTLTIVEIAGEEYAAVRPAPGMFVQLLNLAHQVRAEAIDQAVGCLQFLHECFEEEVIRAALEQVGGYEPEEGDETQFNAEGERLAKSNEHIYARWRSHFDQLGTMTLVDVMIGMTEEWSGNPISSPPASTTGRSRTGGKSTARRSSTASTSRKSPAKARPGSSRRST